MEFEIVTERALTLWELAGRMHGAAVHLPIGGILVLLSHEVINILGWLRLDTRLSLWLTLGSFVPAIATGLLRAQELDSDALIEASVHRNVMILAFTLVCVAGLVRWRSQWYGTYVAILLVALVVLSAGGHLGAEMIHGHEFFTTK